MAGCHDVPLSVETSTPPTLPPPASVAVPVTVSGWPTGTVAPAAGVAMVDVGAVVSLLALAADNPDCRVAGCAPMSANRLTVAWRTAVVGGRRLSRLNGCCLVPKPTAPCRHQRPRRRSEPGTSSGGESPCPARTCCRSPGGSRPRFLVVVDRRIRPAGWKPLSGDSSHS